VKAGRAWVRMRIGLVNKIGGGKREYLNGRSLIRRLRPKIGSLSKNEDRIWGVKVLRSGVNCDRESLPMSIALVRERKGTRNATPFFREAILRKRLIKLPYLLRA